MNRLVFTLLLSVGVARGGDAIGTNYFGPDACASIRRVTAEDPRDNGAAAAGFIWAVTNIYPTMLGYAQERPLAMEATDRATTFRFAWAGTGVNPSCFVARFELGQTNSTLTAAQFHVDSRRAPPYNGLARGQRELTPEEHRRLHSALEEFITTRPLAYPENGALDICPQLFEYRDHERRIVALENGILSTNVLGRLHRLCLDAVGATKLQPVGPANGSQPFSSETDRPSAAAGSRR